MKVPSKPKPRTPQKTKTGASGSGLNAGHIVTFATSSVEAFKSYADMKKEEQVTTRVHMEAQRDIVLGELDVEKARINQATRFSELSTDDQADQRRHQEAMGALDTEARKVDSHTEQTRLILEELKTGKISGEVAIDLIAALGKE
ncbi:TPA: hypothetical protein P2I01_003017 [Aeromonas salmonicida]|uniref:hypothetical protein n=1 Tax=Aeromonas salmonicida TaxID=645 RepID=UPI00330D5787|nr:hypothetical protein [Aeromonas salmonicida]